MYRQSNFSVEVKRPYLNNVPIMIANAGSAVGLMKRVDVSAMAINVFWVKSPLIWCDQIATCDG
jgi:hypothetical protein